VRRPEVRRTSSLASFQQLVELGRSNRQLDANDQGAAVVDWLAVRSTSAPPTSI
jgi:hypothetical protein